jgi:hypothetical protein
MTNLVDIANGIVKTMSRPVQCIHMPVLEDRNDDVYFGPLQGLRLPTRRRSISASCMQAPPRTAQASSKPRGNTPRCQALRRNAASVAATRRNSNRSSMII